ncbi:MAG: TIGR01906 family membrane protein [Anaerolineae bacterium]|nr:TIGR01906 family membrane protein [Anaerolineae bacterium]
MRVLLRTLLIVVVPVILTMGIVRLVTLPWYPAWEYDRPGFPADPLGMSSVERLRLARACIRFLNLPRDFVALDTLKFDDGHQAFEAREISHLEDVKRVYNYLTGGALLALVGGIVASWLLVRYWGWAVIGGAFSDAGLLTLMLLLGLGAWMLLGFEIFFTAFHRVFFTGDSWLFAYTDTLIRLFPLPFWQDAGVLIAIIVGILALILALGGRIFQRRLEIKE